MIRRPAVAGAFYPNEADRLEKQIRSYLKEVPHKEKVKGVVAPHAGYIYSGGVAGAVYSRVEIPRDVIVLGPNHRGMGAAHAVMASGSWDMPSGPIKVNEVLANNIMEHSGLFRNDPSAHKYEHSLEVQIPFIQAFQPEAQLVPIVLSASSYKECEELGKALAAGIRDYGKDVLLVASTDMTHYESHETAQKKDRKAIEKILEMDPEGLLYTVLGSGISMCGVVSTTVVLVACMELGASSAELVAYATSGDASGDYEQVVGYAGLIIL
jgi:MEMO1 family protein